MGIPTFRGEEGVLYQLISFYRNLSMISPVIFASLGGFLFGYDTGTISSAILFMKNQLDLSTAQMELMIGIVSIGAVGGGFGAGLLSDRFGRKKMLLFIACLYAFSAYLQGTAETIKMVFYGRLLVGIAIGLAVAVGPLYIAEIASRERRGMLIAVHQLAVTIGIVFAFLVGYLFAQQASWHLLFGIASIPALLMFIGMLFSPESPRWLVRNYRIEKARASLWKIRKEKEHIEEELDHIQKNFSHEIVSWRAAFSSPVRKALLVGISVAVFQQLIGINAILYYAPTLFTVAGFHTQAMAILATEGVAIVNVFATLIGLLLLDKKGRRSLLISGLVGLISVLFLLGMLFSFPIEWAPLRWLVLGCFMGYIVFFAYSLGSIGYVLNAEIYPLNVRAKMVGIAICCNWIANFIVTSTFLTLIQIFGRPAVFWGYGLIGVIALIFVVKKVPETKGKSLEEIENYWGAS